MRCERRMQGSMAAVAGLALSDQTTGLQRDAFSLLLRHHQQNDISSRSTVWKSVTFPALRVVSTADPSLLNLPTELLQRVFSLLHEADHLDSNRLACLTFTMLGVDQLFEELKIVHRRVSVSWRLNISCQTPLLRALRPLLLPPGQADVSSVGEMTSRTWPHTARHPDDSSR